MVGSSRIRAKASISSLTVSGRKALWTSGRSMVSLTMPLSVRSKRMSVYSTTVVQEVDGVDEFLGVMWRSRC